jgi:hypothetical protein
MKRRIAAACASLALCGGIAAVPIAAEAQPVTGVAPVPVAGTATSSQTGALPVVGTVSITDVTNGLVSGVFNGTVGGVPVTGKPVTANLLQTPGTCQVLNLTLGPLDLNLLGLMIHLDQVHLTITAQRGGGLLGDLLCGLAGG